MVDFWSLGLRGLDWTWWEVLLPHDKPTRFERITENRLVGSHDDRVVVLQIRPLKSLLIREAEITQRFLAIPEAVDVHGQRHLLRSTESEKEIGSDLAVVLVVTDRF